MASDNNLDFEKQLKEIIPLIKKIASNYLNNMITMEELIQEGTLGAYEAFKRFNPDKNVKFSTYATFWIKKYIMKYAQDIGGNKELDKKLFAETDKTIDIPESNFPKKIVISNNFPAIERKILELLFNEEKTLKEISQILKMPRERVRQIKEKALRRLRATKSK